ncbi:hypothetical protein DFP79_0047 [Marinomonas balearica]|jgi:hypothetical protein|uniref:Uncharacterized protein n=2 Tax=Marinomonas TaxID=28253 RepID=F2JXQ0_MARM1|nr:hypothetical protein Marme_3838 [Marinomonas mediterranea MMB-1]TDP01872.1 hypothetical protein DFP79_0047 [Marinomonas balearica]
MYRFFGLIDRALPNNVKQFIKGVWLYLLVLMILYALNTESADFIYWNY